MIETDIECGHTKTTLYARGVNESCKMITSSPLNSSNFNVTLCRKKLSQYWSYQSYHLRCSCLSSSFGSVLKLLFDDFFHMAFGYTVS